MSNVIDLTLGKRPRDEKHDRRTRGHMPPPNGYIMDELPSQPPNGYVMGALELPSQPPNRYAMNALKRRQNCLEEIADKLMKKFKIDLPAIIESHEFDKLKRMLMANIKTT